MAERIAEALRAAGAPRGALDADRADRLREALSEIHADAPTTAPGAGFEAILDPLRRPLDAPRVAQDETILLRARLSSVSPTQARLLAEAPFARAKSALLFVDRLRMVDPLAPLLEAARIAPTRKASAPYLRLAAAVRDALFDAGPLLADGGLIVTPPRPAAVDVAAGDVAQARADLAKRIAAALQALGRPSWRIEFEASPGDAMAVLTRKAEVWLDAGDALASSAASFSAATAARAAADFAWLAGRYDPTALPTTPDLDAVIEARVDGVRVTPADAPAPDAREVGRRGMLSILAAPLAPTPTEISLADIVVMRRDEEAFAAFRMLAAEARAAIAAAEDEDAGAAATAEIVGPKREAWIRETRARMARGAMAPAFEAGAAVGVGLNLGAAGPRAAEPARRLAAAAAALADGAGPLPGAVAASRAPDADPDHPGCGHVLIAPPVAH